MTGWANIGLPYCTGELKRQVLRISNGKRKLVQLAENESNSYGTEGCDKQGIGFYDKHHGRGADINIVQILGIAVDETERVKRHTKEGILLPLVEVGWTEADCKQWCIDNDLLSPIYTDETTRGGCWFCHNQGVNQLRILRRDYPDLWKIMLKWDLDSPVTFHPDGHTVHDFDRRFQMEDEGLIDKNERFKWKYLEEVQTRLF